MCRKRSGHRARTARRGSAAVEFALVCAPFVVFLLAIMVIAFDFYVQQALDYSTQQAARQIQIGQVPPSYTAADFLSKVFCPIFGQFQNCANVAIDVHPVIDYQSLALPGVTDGPNSTASRGYVFCTGQPGQLIYVHAVYLAPLGTPLILISHRTSRRKPAVL